MKIFHKKLGLDKSAQKYRSVKEIEIDIKSELKKKLGMKYFLNEIYEIYDKD